MDWLTGIDYQGLGLTIGYPQHDKVGNRKQRTEAVAPEGAVATDYAFDATYQLTQAKTGAGEENYVYDKVGNRQSGPTVKDTAAAAYDHDAANRMLQGRKFTYAYDARGNQSRKYLSADQTKRWEFTWDGENRLREAKLIADAATLRTVTFAYDPFGRRVRKEVQGLAPQVPVPLTTTYTYDGEDIVLQLESDGTTATTTKYVHGPGIDEPLAMLRGGASTFYHADGLGSVVAVSDGNKSIVARYEYDAFGMVSASDPEFANPYAYTGREWDREIGLYYYRARFYDPMEGRFISRDPIGFAGGDVNVYRYVQNNPINFIDPSGNIEPLTALAIIALAKAGAIAIPWATMRATAYFMGDPEVSCSVGDYHMSNLANDMAFATGLVNLGTLGVGAGALALAEAGPPVYYATMAATVTPAGQSIINNAPAFIDAWMPAEAPPQPSVGGYLGWSTKKIFDKVNSPSESSK
jgi:RHS repeat-associated protein